MIKATYAYVLCLCVPEHQFDKYKYGSTGSNQPGWTKAARPTHRTRKACLCDSTKGFILTPVDKKKFYNSHLGMDGKSMWIYMACYRTSQKFNWNMSHFWFQFWYYNFCPICLIDLISNDSENRMHRKFKQIVKYV